MSALHYKLFNSFKYCLIFFKIQSYSLFSWNFIFFSSKVSVWDDTGHFIFLVGCGNFSWFDIGMSQNIFLFDCNTVYLFREIEVLPLVTLVSLLSNKNKRCSTKFYLYITGISTLLRDFEFWILFEEIQRLYVSHLSLFNGKIGQDIVIR